MSRRTLQCPWCYRPCGTTVSLRAHLVACPGQRESAERLFNAARRALKNLKAFRPLADPGSETEAAYQQLRSAVEAYRHGLVEAELRMGVS